MSSRHRGLKPAVLGRRQDFALRFDDAASAFAQTGEQRPVHRDATLAPSLAACHPGWLSVDGGRSEPLLPGDVFAILPGERSRYREDPQRPWRYTWLGFHGPAAPALLAQAGIAGAVRVLRGVATPALWRLCDEAEAAYSADACSPDARLNYRE